MRNLIFFFKPPINWAVKTKKPRPVRGGQKGVDFSYQF